MMQKQKHIQLIIMEQVGKIFQIKGDTLNVFDSMGEDTLYTKVK